MSFLRKIQALSSLIAALVFLPGNVLKSRAGEYGPPPPTDKRMAEISAEIDSCNSSPDDLWAYIEKWSEEPNWHADRLLPKNERAAAEAVFYERPYRLRFACEEFLKRYPSYPRRWGAKVLLLKGTEHISRDQQYMDACREVAAAPDAEARFKDIARELLLLCFLSSSKPHDEVEKVFTDYERDYPDAPIGAVLVQERVRYLSYADPERLVPALRVLMESPNKAATESARREYALRAEPLQWKFTTIEGKAFDIAKLRGQVVLLCFWAAAWGDPEKDILPKALSVWKKFRGKEFQIVGICQDTNRKAMRKAIKTHGMDWPQCNDSREDEGSATAMRFHVHSAHGAWLVDRKGVAHELPEGADLDRKVQDLLQDLP